MVEHLDLHSEWLVRRAEAAEVQEERSANDLAEAWDDCLKKRSIDAEIGGKYYSDLIEVLNNACSDGDQKINRALMQALVNCAANGQPDAVMALDKVKYFFITKTMEFHQ